MRLLKAASTAKLDGRAILQTASSARGARATFGGPRMPTTRRGARGGGRLLLELPADALGLVLYQPLAHDIAAVAPTCHALGAPAKLAMRRGPSRRGRDARWARPPVASRARLLTWRWRPTAASSPARPDHQGVARRRVERTIQAHTVDLIPVALPGGSRFVSGSVDRTAKLWTLDGASSAISRLRSCSPSRRCPTACTLWSAAAASPAVPRRRHARTPSRGTPSRWAVAVTRDGQRIISGWRTSASRCGASPPRAS